MLVFFNALNGRDPLADLPVHAEISIAPGSEANAAVVRGYSEEVWGALLAETP
ncbi:MAG: hypothetical protein HXY40_15520 [Chloroflexi bacterium]|nr:hypothetical protein [Chloroflexota bacterium]